MSLPPTFLDDLRSRLSLAQVVGRKVMWDQRKSNQGRGDLWAPCPFHQEKTASFHVDDRKGFYYCFGCHAKGDAISFVRQSENVEFMEAVRILAEEAGMQMPERDPRAAEKADRRTELTDVMEEAVRFFGLQLRSGGGQAARDYLDRRGLGEDARARWELGFAPGGWQALRAHLKGKGIADETILAAGLAKTSDRGREPYDTFRNRIMFPIRDPRGRTIAFGGRAMDPDDSAKYLNSPETELFDKGRTLYNHGPARSAAGKGAPLVVAEGYMDVIALGEAGFGAVVAPLGTAITEAQLQLLWRIDPEPVIALDGDAAGRRAAMRVIDLALPILEAGRSVRFCLMPEGQDPDDLLKSGGAGAMRRQLDAALPMVEVLWRRETEGLSIDSPERRAALDKRLREVLGGIKDPTIRRHYGEAIRERRWQLFNPRRARGPWRKRETAPSATAALRSSALASDDTAGLRMREAVVLSVLVRHPALLSRFDDALEQVAFDDPTHARIAAELLRLDPSGGDLSGSLHRALGGDILEKVTTARHLSIVPALRGDDAELAAQCLTAEMAKLSARRGAQRELDEALEDIAAVTDEALTWRLSEAASAVARAEKSQTEDRTEYEVASNGLRLSRSERDTLHGLAESIDFARGKKKT